MLHPSDIMQTAINVLWVVAGVIFAIAVAVYVAAVIIKTRANVKHE